MAYTCAQLIDEISAQLHGWGTTADRVTALTNTIDSNDLTFTVDYPSGQAVGISPGVVEIDSEQLYVTTVDAQTGVCVVANGFGRGYSGTTPAAHTAGAKVTTRPRFPRKWIFNSLNQVISSIYPDLFAVETFTGTVTWPSNTYTMPVVPPMGVLNAEWQDHYENWHRIPSYTTDAYDGKFRIWSRIDQGRPFRVTYSVEPTPFLTEADLLTDTGLPDSCSDVLTLGVVAAQVPGLDISRAQLTTIEQTDRSRDIPASAALQAARYLTGEYRRRLGEEAKALRKRYKPRMVRVL